MEIIGKYKGKLIERCCPQGKWHFTDIRYSGAMYCKHHAYSGYWDDFNGYIDELPEVTNKDIIREAKEQKILNQLI